MRRFGNGACCLVLAVEEDKPIWGCRWEARMVLEQPHSLGFLGRDQNGDSSLQMSHQSKF